MATPSEIVKLLAAARVNSDFRDFLISKPAAAAAAMGVTLSQDDLDAINDVFAAHPSAKNETPIVDVQAAVTWSVDALVARPRQPRVYP